MVGFCFSFPVEQTSVSSGKLLRWTKGYTNPGAVGSDPAKLLGEAFKRRVCRICHGLCLFGSKIIAPLEDASRRRICLTSAQPVSVWQLQACSLHLKHFHHNFGVEIYLYAGHTMDYT